jgi:macrolide transport system ATP-binding/permease protein
VTGLRTWVLRVKGTLLRRRLDDELEEEIRSHLEMQADEFVRQGISADEARLEARRRFGGVEQVKETYRDRRGLPAVESLARDLRYSARLLGRAPVFAGVAIATLGIGIGASTAMFTLLNRAMLQPLPVSEPGQLVSLNNSAPNRVFPTFSYPTYLDLRDRNTVFAGLAAYRFVPISVSHSGVNERLWGYIVTGNYFEMLGVTAAQGRMLVPSDDVGRGAHAVTVVSYRFWQQRLGAATDVLSRTVLVNGRNYTIVGVAPQQFYGTEVASSPDLWFPMSMQPQLDMGSDWLDDRGVENIFVIARMKPDVTIEQARAAMTAAAIQLEHEHPALNEGKRITLTRPGLMGSMMRGPVLGVTALLLLISGLVLLLACTNLANLLLARAADRRREIAVRLSLGAGRVALVRQLLTESLLLSGAAGFVGLLLAFWMVRLLVAFKLPVDIPLALDLPIDGRVLAFNVLLSIAAGVFFGLLPALQSTKADLATVLKGSGPAGDSRDSTWKKGLIVAQVALSLVLLVAGGLTVRSLARAQAIPLGFTPEQAIEVTFDLRLQGYSPAQGREFQQRVLERVRPLPGVQHAAIADMIPVDLHFTRSRVFAEGTAPESSGRAPRAFTSRVSTSYFQTMNTRLEEGRDFTDFDDEGSTRVAIVNRALVRRFWPDGDAIGRRFRLGEDGPLLEVVGIAQDGKYAGFNEDPHPFVYRPIRQSYAGSTSVIVRTRGDTASMIAVVQREIRAMDPHMPFGNARTLVERLALPLLPARVAAWLLGSFGALALVLAAVGLYGVMSYMVSSRTHEIGVRMAMGARRADVLALVLGQGLRLTAIGLAIGIAGALVLTPFMRALLYGVSSRDALTYASVLVVLALVALVACLVPARRATRMDPVWALRGE